MLTFAMLTFVTLTFEMLTFAMLTLVTPIFAMLTFESSLAGEIPSRCDSKLSSAVEEMASSFAAVPTSRRRVLLTRQ